MHASTPDRQKATVQGGGGEVANDFGRERTTARSRGARKSADIGGEPRKTALFRGEGVWGRPPEQLRQKCPMIVGFLLTSTFLMWDAAGHAEPAAAYLFSDALFP